MIKDYYRILQISRNSTHGVIKKSYRKLALDNHPDRNKTPEAHSLFIEINEAYQILSDYSKRKVYDSLLQEHEENYQITSLEKNQDLYYAYKAWTNQAREESNNLSKLTYPEFLQQIKKNLGEAVAKSINFLSIIYGIGFGCTGIYGLVNTTYSLYKGEYKFTLGIIILYPLFLIFSAIGLFQVYDLFKNVASD